MKPSLSITLNSTVLYLIAFLLTTILHESSHAFFGMMYGTRPVMHHNFVEHFSKDHLTAGQAAVISLAGPLLSLIQGLFSGLAFIRFQGTKLKNLFLLWFSVLGFNNFFGYLMTGPFFSNGDIGKIYRILEVPLIFQILLAVAGAALLTFLAYKLTRPFLSFSYETQWLENKNSRKKFNSQIIIFPWLIGSAIITVLYMPVIALISIIYPVMSGMIFIFPWQNADSIENSKISAGAWVGKISFAPVLLLLALILVFKFILAPGINL